MIFNLHVDDKPSLIELGKTFFEKSGSVQVEISLSVAGAQKWLTRLSCDAIVSDYQMLLINGIGLLKFIRSLYGVLLFILFTGRGCEDVVVKALNIEADFYLQKGRKPCSSLPNWSTRSNRRLTSGSRVS
ncbi:MAG: response regulator [Methanomicrobiales archaeon]